MLTTPGRGFSGLLWNKASKGRRDPRIEPGSPALQADPLPSEPPGKPNLIKSLSHEWKPFNGTQMFLRMKSEPLTKALHHHRSVCIFSSVQLSRSVVSDSLRPHELKHTRPPCPSPTPGVYPNSCPLSWWCLPTSSSSVVPFSSCPLSFLASGSFQMSQLFASGDQSIGVSPSASGLSMNMQDWSPLGWTGWISLQSKGLSRVFSNTTVQKHQFFGTQLSLCK